MRQLSFIVTYMQALFKQEIRPQERTGELVYDVKTVLKTLKRGTQNTQEVDRRLQNDVFQILFGGKKVLYNKRCSFV